MFTKLIIFIILLNNIFEYYLNVVFLILRIRSFLIFFINKLQLIKKITHFYLILQTNERIIYFLLNI